VHYSSYTHKEIVLACVQKAREGRDKANDYQWRGLAMVHYEVPISIKMGVDEEGFKRQAATDPILAANHLDPELRVFEQWMMSRGMEPLTSVEKQIVREYLGYKLVV
jgi:hypothetical protein